MHGVGHAYAVKAFEAFGLPPFVGVKEQIVPDPDFPTVAYPNPEEGKGALSLAMKTADAAGASIILANDPDADRLATAEKQPSGQWHIFSGNELGSILGCFLLDAHKATQKQDKKTAMLASTVSSKMLKAVAEREGFHFEDTLTGFKWLGNRAIELQKAEFEVLFAFEEAIGFMVGDIVKDKDGVSALAVFAENAAALARNGMTVYQYLQSLYAKYGYFVTENSYFICHEPAVIKRIFDKIRYGSHVVDGASEPSLKYPKTIGKHTVAAVRDLTVGYDSDRHDKKPTLPVSRSSQMITFRMANNATITLRTSGTEPKIKYYSELSGASMEAARKELSELIEAFTEELLEPKANGLIYRTG
ncbi:Phosphoglucomutase-2 [Quaeritorhiza haematococci]|nr:Phosphoglucomutase-2 [Quaeritorhiza haematococci]